MTMTMVENVLACILFWNETSLSYVAIYKLKIKKKEEREKRDGGRNWKERKELMSDQKSKGMNRQSTEDAPGGDTILYDTLRADT